MPVERAQIDGTNLTAGRTRVGEPGDASGNRGADGRVEPQGPTACLASVPDGNDLLRINDRLATAYRLSDIGSSCAS